MPIIEPQMDAAASARSHAEVTPHASLNFGCARALRIGGAGDVAVVGLDDVVVIYTCVAGEVLTVQCKRVNLIGTDATNIVAWF
jgi:hypothetical protein